MVATPARTPGVRAGATTTTRTDRTFVTAADDVHPPTRPIVLNPGDALSSGRRLIYVLVLGALVALGPFTVDMYLPAFPEIADELHTSEALLQLTLTATMIGFALGQLLIGPLSDKIGRRIPLLVMTGVHVVASLGVVIAPNVEVMFVIRVLQGVGAAGGAVVAMAMVRDLFGGQRLVRMLARLALVSGLAPILAPVIGSQLLAVLPWRGIFIVLAGYGTVVVALVAFLIIETLPPARRVDVGHSTARDRYRALFTDRIFLGILLVGAMNFSSLFSYVSSSSFLLQETFGLDPQQYGAVFAINSIGLAIMSQVSSRLMRRIPPQWLIAVALSVGMLAALAIGLGAILGGGLLAVVIPLFFLIAAAGLTFPAAQVIALAHHGKEAGTAASLLGAINFGLAALITPIVGVLGSHTALPMASVMFACLLVGQLALWLIVRPRTVPSIGD